MDKIRAVFNWSGGKDSAHALLRAMETGCYEIVALLTTVNRDTHRSTMHGIPLSLLEAQAASIGIPLYIVDLTPEGNMEDYSSAMLQAVQHFKTLGVTHFIFGDIFLHDVRQYREQQLVPYSIEVVEPLWGKSSEQVMEDFLSSELKTIVVTTMNDGLGAAAIGKLIDRDFVASLPAETEKTVNIIPFVMTGRFSILPFRIVWENPSHKVMILISMMGRLKLIHTGLPI